MTTSPQLLAQAADSAANAFFGLGIFGLILAALALLFWVWMLIDALTNASLLPTTKILWALVIFALPFVGALAYVLIGRETAAQRELSAPGREVRELARTVRACRTDARW